MFVVAGFPNRPSPIPRNSWLPPPSKVFVNKQKFSACFSHMLFKGLFINDINQLGGREVSQKMTKDDGGGVWQKMTDGEDEARGRREKTLTAL